MQNCYDKRLEKVSFKDTINSYFRNYTFALFYVPLILSVAIFYGKGTIPWFNIKVPLIIGYMMVAISAYSFYLLYQDYKAISVEFELATSQRNTIQEAAKKEVAKDKDDDFDKVLGDYR